MERKSTTLTKSADETLRAPRPEPPTEETSKEGSVSYVGKTRKALLDSARERKVESQRDGEEASNQTRNVLARLTGSRAVRLSVMNVNSEGRALSYCAPDNARLPAPD